MQTITNIGVQPKEKITMNKKMKVMPALDRAALPVVLSSPATMANVTTSMEVAVNRFLRRPKLSTKKDP